MSRRSQREISVLVPPNLLPLSRAEPRRLGPYLVIGRVGSGGTGSVYAAVNPTVTDDPLVAVKALSSPHLADDATRDLLHRRLEALSHVDGRCYVPPIAFDAHASPPWIAMGYVSGIPLAQYVRRRGALGPGRLIALAAGLAEGILALHAKQVAHGDLKPSNVLLGTGGPRILDCALPGDDEHLRSAAATWLSPERHAGAPPGPAADVFAWGGVMAFAATGRLPFGLAEPHIVAGRVADGEPDLTGVPADLLPLVSRALAKDPADRPTVRELIGAAIAVWEQSDLQAERQRGEDRAVPGTAVTRVLTREWQGVVEPARLPRVITVQEGPDVRPGKAAFAAVGAAVALALLGGGAWAAYGALGGGPEETAAPVTASPAPDQEEGTTVVRFDPTQQDNPVDGPWVYVEVEREQHKDDAPEGDPGFLTQRDWAAQWDETGRSERRTAVIDPEAEVRCARFCRPGPGHIEDGRGTYEMTGQEFIDYLGWGDIVIAEVEFAEARDDDGQRTIVRITELFPQPVE
ncbi:hypothetical protein HNR23_001117 [Nocardiopsis mwathae]|uniref:Protein kinase domain-containing protein n=1 Tax=Nocardiopsis mwathae TaxID=1472723 RepID=A0A7W9YFB9_9ACTN|nr:serine/threonine-protein kinase [Nocardiopsis mwathae]MBB6171057.1 hypothetical protein [Nocardiopsis mwathae]